jgi:hypothetical protein
LLRFPAFFFRALGFDLALLLAFPLGLPLGFGLPLRFRGALTSPSNEILIA